MKAIFSTSIFLILCLSAKSQFVNFSDQNLKLYFLHRGVDTNEDGEISFEEAKIPNQFQPKLSPINDDIATFYHDQYGYPKERGAISNLSGLSYFTNLTVIIIQNELIVDIDLTPFKFLRNVILSGPPIKYLNLKGLDQLQHLNLIRVDISYLDISTNLGLEYVSFTFIDQNLGVCLPPGKKTTDYESFNISYSPNITTSNNCGIASNVSNSQKVNFNIFHTENTVNIISNDNIKSLIIYNTNGKVVLNRENINDSSISIDCNTCLHNQLLIFQIETEFGQSALSHLWP